MNIKTFILALAILSFPAVTSAVEKHNPILTIDNKAKYTKVTKTDNPFDTDFDEVYVQAGRNTHFQMGIPSPPKQIEHLGIRRIDLRDIGLLTATGIRYFVTEGFGKTVEIWTTKIQHPDINIIVRVTIVEDEKTTTFELTNPYKLYLKNPNNFFLN